MAKQLLLTVALIFQSLVPTTLKAQLSVDLRGQVCFYSTGCPNKFEVGETQCSEAQNSLRAKRATFTKKCVFRSKKFRFEHFFCKLQNENGILTQLISILLNKLVHKKME